MKQQFLPLISLLVVAPCLSGCQYDRSFMQMDSNSGVPFFGLQLAVDSGSRPPRLDPESLIPESPTPAQKSIERDRMETVIPPRSDSAAAPLRMQLVSRHDAPGGHSLEPTSRLAALNGRIRYSLPQDNSGHQSIAERVDLRRAAF